MFRGSITAALALSLLAGLAPSPAMAEIPPAGVTWHRDIEFARVDDQPILLDIYEPDNTDGPLPLVVYIHGGGWTSGSRKNCKATHLSGLGYVVASIDYRLLDEAIFPAQIYDCKAAIRWLRANAEQYSINPNRVGVWGNSAGAHLSSLVGTSGGVAELEGDIGVTGYSSSVQAVLSVAGPCDMLDMFDRYGSDPDGAVYRLFGGPLEETHDLIVDASPIAHISFDDPPFLLVHGDHDYTVPYTQSVKFEQALLGAGVDVTLYTIPDGRHGTQDDGADAAIIAFFDQHLKPVPEPATLGLVGLGLIGLVSRRKK